MIRFAASLVLVFALSGCSMYGGSVPTVVPTGNPVTDVLVGALVQEGAQALAHAVVADGSPVLVSAFNAVASPRYGDGCYAGDYSDVPPDDSVVLYRDPGRLTVIRTRNGDIAHFLY